MHRQLLGQLFLDGPASLEVDYPCFPFVLVEIRSSFQICLIRQLLALNRAYAVRLHEHDSPIWSETCLVLIDVQVGVDDVLIGVVDWKAKQSRC